MFLLDFAEFEKASFGLKKKKSKNEEEKPKRNRDWNNWEKARELRSGVSTAQRVSQDVRGWLNMAKRLGA